MRKSFSFYLLISALLCFTAVTFADEEDAFVRQLVQRYQSGQQLTPAEKEIVSEYLSAGIQTINANRGRHGRIAPEGSQAVVLGPETFDVFPPAGWTVTDNGNGNAWAQTTDPTYGGGTDNFASWNDDAWGLGSIDATTMTTSAFSTVGLTNGVSLIFDYGHRALGGAPFSVEVSNDSGATWQTVVADLPGTTTTLTTPVPEAANYLVDITAAAGENPNVMVRFAFDDLGGWQWHGSVDNVTVSESTVDLAVTQFIGLSTLVGASQTINFQIEVASIGAVDAPATSLDLSQNGSVVSTVAVGALASGAVDTLDVSFTSSASGIDELVASLQAVAGDDNLLNDTLSATVTVSNSIPLPFTEDWPTATFDPGLWPAAGQAGTPTIEPFPGASLYPMPSDPNVLNIHGPGTIVTSSALFDLSGITDPLVLAMYESENDLEIGESVFLEYQLSDGSWAVLHEFVGTDNGFDLFEPFELVVFSLPADAYHSAFAFRWRSNDLLASTDEWFFDDIYLGSPDANPVMSVSPASIDDLLLVGGSRTHDITVSNLATQPSNLNYTVTIDGGGSWISTAPTSGTVATNGSEIVTLTLDASALTPNTYTADVIVSGDDANNASDTVAVSLVVNDAPVLSVSPTSLSTTLTPPATSTDMFTISNNGSGPMDWSIDVNTDVGAKVTTSISKPRANMYNLKPHAGSPLAERTPVLRNNYRPSIEAPFDLEFSFDVTAVSGAGGNAGSEFDGTYYYTTRWASNLIHKYDTAGNLVEEFSIPGVTGLRDLAWDGQYMYGGAAGTTIFEMDFVNKTLVSSITGVAQPVRHIAYDDGADGFWVGNWDTDVVLVDRSGATVSSIPAATHGLGGMYGSAYDGYSDGGPYLWLYDQGLGAGTSQLMHQFSIASGTATGFTFDTTVDFPDVNALAGGLFVAAGIVSGEAVLGGLQQGVPDQFFVYELAPAAVSGAAFAVDTTAGTLPANSSLVVNVTFNSNDLVGGTYNADIVVNSNDPVNPADTVAATMTVLGTPIGSVDPDSVFFAGTTQLGETALDTFNVVNDGNDSLIVTSLTSSSSVLTVVNDGFVVAPFSSEPVEITFAPTAAGVATADITISTNDPNNPTLSVYAEAEGVNSPVMAVSPDSLIATVAPGTPVTQSFTIANNGAGPLDFAVAIEGVDKNNAKVDFIGTDGKGLNNQVLARGKPFPLHKLTKNVRSQNAEADINLPSTPGTGLSKISLPEGVNALEEVFGSNASAFGPSGLRGRGNLFTCTTSTTLTEHRLYLNVTAATDLYFVVAESDAQVGDYTVVSVSDVSPSATGEGWYSSGDISVPMVAGKYYLIFAQWDANANYYNEQNITPYPIAASFGELTAGGGWSTGSVPVYANPPATTHPIAATAFADPVAYYQTIVTGSGTGFVTVGTTSGTVAGASSVDVNVTFSADGLVADDYYANIIVSGNDPANPTDTVAAKMTALGGVAISANPDSLYFDGTTFAGGTAVDSFWVVNSGNDTLIVSGMTSSSSSFTVIDDGFVVPPFDSTGVYVTFAPTAAGVQSGTVTVSSNDPNTPSLAVYVEAEAVDPPVMVVDPDSVNETLAYNDSTDFIISISNETGGATLDWSADLQFMPYSGKQRRLVNPSGSKPSVGTAASREKSPTLSQVSSSSIDAPFDLLFSIDVTTVSTAAGNAGAEFDGTYYYTTRWASNLIHKYDTAGNLVEEFSITGVTGLRDLAWDGTFMYGGAAGTTIYQMDFTNKILVGSITGVAQPVRHIAYDDGSDGFWVGNWDTDVVLVDRSGSTVASLSAAAHGLGGMYGSAYDNHSTGGPYLWLYDQGLGAGTSQVMHQFSIASGTATGLTYDTTVDFPDVNALAGGLFISDEVVPGLAVLGGMQQGVPDQLFVYELAPASGGGGLWMRLLSDGSGSIAAGDVGAISCRLSTANIDTTYQGYIEITSNDPANPSQVVIVNLTADPSVGITIEDIIPNSFDVSENYPNPFNPTTTINYDIPKVADVRLVIYNVLGQKVRTLVNQKAEPGKYKVIWDGLNDNGAQVASGVYIYRFEAADYLQVKKMILLK